MKEYCFVGYATHKVIKWKDKLVSPNLDSEILDKVEADFSVFCFGKPDGEEFFDSIHLENRPPKWKILLNSIRAGRIHVKDIVFLFDLFRHNEFFPIFGALPRPLWALWAIRTYVVARHFAYVFRNIAEEHRQARVIVYYSAAMLGVVYAFRKLGKPVHEIQHGYIGPSHNAYNKKATVSSDSHFAPTGYILWDDRTAKFLEGLGAKNIEVVGFRHLNNFANASPSGKKVVLVTTQFLTPLPACMEALVRSIRDVTWRFRLHPREDDPREDIKSLLRYGNVEMSGSNTTLADDLADSVLHLTTHSSALHEAAAMGVVSLFSTEVGKERFHPEISRGLAYFIDGETAVPTALRLLEVQRVTPSV